MICPHCYEEFKFEIRLDFHLLYQCDKNETRVECFICKSRQKSKKDLLIHLSCIHFNKEIEEEEKKDIEIVEEEIKIDVEEIPITEDSQEEIEEIFISENEAERPEIEFLYEVKSNSIRKLKKEKQPPKFKIKKYRKNCFNSNKRFRNKMNFSIFKYKFVIQDGNVKIEHLLNKKKEKRNKKFKTSVTCMLCRTKLNSLMHYIKHFKSKHKIKLNPHYRCHKCGMKASTIKSHSNHMIKQKCRKRKNQQSLIECPSEHAEEVEIISV